MKLLFVLLCFEDHVLKNDYWHESHLCVGRDWANLPGTALPQKVLTVCLHSLAKSTLGLPTQTSQHEMCQGEEKAGQVLNHQVNFSH